jgi:hypothetical protein
MKSQRRNQRLSIVGRRRGFERKIRRSRIRRRRRASRSRARGR